MDFSGDTQYTKAEIWRRKRASRCTGKTEGAGRAPWWLRRGGLISRCIVRVAKITGERGCQNTPGNASIRTVGMGGGWWFFLFFYNLSQLDLYVIKFWFTHDSILPPPLLILLVASARRWLAYRIQRRSGGNVQGLLWLPGMQLKCTTFRNLDEA